MAKEQNIRGVDTKRHIQHSYIDSDGRMVRDAGELFEDDQMGFSRDEITGKKYESSTIGSSWLAETTTSPSKNGEAFSNTQEEYEGIGNIGKDLDCIGDVDCIIAHRE